MCHTSGDGSHHKPSAVTGGVICLGSIHNRKQTALQTPVRFFFRSLLNYFDTQLVKNVLYNEYIECQ